MGDYNESSLQIEANHGSEYFFFTDLKLSLPYRPLIVRVCKN